MIFSFSSCIVPYFFASWSDSFCVDARATITVSAVLPMWPLPPFRKGISNSGKLLIGFKGNDCLKDDLSAYFCHWTTCPKPIPEFLCNLQSISAWSITLPINESSSEESPWSRDIGCITWSQNTWKHVTSELKLRPTIWVYYLYCMWVSNMLIEGLMLRDRYSFIKEFITCTLNFTFPRTKPLTSRRYFPSPFQTSRSCWPPLPQTTARSAAISWACTRSPGRCTSSPGCSGKKKIFYHVYTVVNPEMPPHKFDPRGWGQISEVACHFGCLLGSAVY